MTNKKIIKELVKFKVDYLFNNGTMPPPHITEAFITTLTLIK